MIAEAAAVAMFLISQSFDKERGLWISRYTSECGHMMVIAHTLAEAWVAESKEVIYVRGLACPPAS